jgi:hypothetical protein
MPDMDKVESLLKLADFSWRAYSERRSIEWKINFALCLARLLLSVASTPPAQGPCF